MLPNLRVIFSTLGLLLVFLGASLILPMLVALGYGEPAWWSFAATAAFSAGLGALLWRRLGGLPDDLGIRDGFAIVALAWFVLSLVGAIPFVLGGVLESYTDAFFETMSGFTTTGASILGGARNPAIEEVPHAFLFWRSLTHWIGGMGIIVLTIAILPVLSVGGMQLYKAEVPGPSTDKLTPRVRETARRLWLIYVGLTAIQVVLLLPGMSLFDAVNHAFATMSSGGFSTRDASIASFASPYVEWVVTFFTFLAGANFALHYRVVRGRPIRALRDTELQVYTWLVVVATALVTVGTWRPIAGWLPHAERAAASFDGYAGLLESVRYAAFQVVTIITTTGFTSADYEIWPPLAVGVIFLLFFSGGMAGSTAGGPKIIRHVLMFKNSFREIKRLIHPAAVIPVRLNGTVVSESVMSNVLSFIVLYLGGIGVGTALMFVVGLDVLSAFGATLSCIGNIGPAFGTMGPTENYAHLPAVGKWVLSFLMMAGRLELFTVLILFTPGFWKR